MLNLDIQHFAEAPAEGTDAGNGGNDAQGGGNSSKTFTQADVDKIVNERTDRAAKAALCFMPMKIFIYKKQMKIFYLFM